MRKLLLLSALCATSLLSARSFRGAAANEQIRGADQLAINDTRNTIQFVHYRTDAQPVVGDMVSYLKTLLKADGNTSFNLYATETDQLGWIHYRFRETYKNMEVEDGVFYIHTLGGKIASGNGEHYAPIQASMNGSVTQQQAEQTAYAKLNAQELMKAYLMDATVQKIFRGEDGIFHACWKVDAWSELPMKRCFYYVDISSGKIVGERTRICHTDVQGSAQTAYNGTQTIITDSINPTTFRLYESGRGGGIHTYTPGPAEITDSDNFWTSTVNLEQYAMDAHFGGEMVFDFYLSYFGRNSIDNANMPVNLQVHDGAYAGALWTGSFSAFGDGDGLYYPMTSIDVVGHEMTHGVTQFSAGLIYANESGALNESFSDIMGVTARWIYNPSVATWYFGDQACIPNTASQPPRSFSNPNQFFCADTYGGLWFNFGDVVHYDSGIQNFWFYLLCNGGSDTNDIGNVYNVSAINMMEACSIAYRNLTVYLTPNSTFADAALYAELAAVDLYGQCSNQQVQTMNAWYAVGVGGPFNSAVISNFTAVPTVACSVPATVSFFNTSWNSTSWNWDFGDGNFSTQQSPTHTYTNPGTYNVTLIANGTAACLGADTLLINSAITVNNFPGPVAATCAPATTNFCCGNGITNVTFNTINWNSNNAFENYSDFTCADSTLLIAGDPYPINVTTGGAPTSSDDEAITVFIDYDNDGAFTGPNEMVYADSGSINQLHSGWINTSVNATLNTRLRMRVISDITTNTITGGCYSPARGQVEDYMVYFIPNTLPPDANFTANIFTIPVAGSVNFTDLTLHAPTNWSWTFTGGTPVNSSIQCPQNIQYNTVGLYPVKLVATNPFGSDSITQIQYINVVSTANMCQQTTMTSLSGILYDQGGPNGDYIDSLNCTFIIEPACAESLQLTFTFFDIQQSFDVLYVRDGNTASSPWLGTFTGATLPPVLYSSSGAFFLEFSSNNSYVRPGFAAQWTSVAMSNAPITNFTYAPSSPPATTPVQFTDQSVNSPTNWFWDFGDAGTSTLQNPTHVYANAGTYTVTLVTCNCVTCDTVAYSISVVPNGVEETSLTVFELFPVPFSDHTTLTLSEGIDPSSITIGITDVAGRTVQSVKAQSHVVMLYRNGMSAGVYFVNLYDADGNTIGVRRIVIAD